MATALVGAAAADAACAGRLDLVDAAFDGKPHAIADLRDHYCTHCPIERPCFSAGMGEPRGLGGVWGGASANQRTRAINRRHQEKP